MLLSNYQLLTLYNNLLDIFAPIYINLVNFVGALSKWMQIYQLPYFHFFGNHFTCFHFIQLTDNEYKRLIAFQCIIYIYWTWTYIYIYIWNISSFGSLYFLTKCLDFDLNIQKSPWWSIFNISYISEPCRSTRTQL